MPAIVEQVVKIRCHLDATYRPPKLYCSLLEQVKAANEEEQKKEVIRAFCKKELGLSNPVFFTPKHAPQPDCEKNRCHTNVVASMMRKTAPQHCWKISLSPTFNFTPIPEAVMAIFHSVLRHDNGTFLEITPQEESVDFYVLEERFIFERTIRDLCQRTEAWRKNKDVELAYKNYGKFCEPGPIKLKFKRFRLQRHPFRCITFRNCSPHWKESLRRTPLLYSFV